MPASPAAGPAGHGLVLVRGQARATARWLRRGLVPVAAVELPGWVGVCLAQTNSLVSAPYDVGLEVLAARPTPVRRRPSIGLFVLDGCAVVTVQPRGWRADQRWLVWQPGVGVRRTPSLPALPTSLLVAAAGTGVPAAHVSTHFRDASGHPLDRLCGLLDVLGLPGQQLLREGAPKAASVIEPAPAAIRGFERVVLLDAAEHEAHR